MPLLAETEPSAQPLSPNPYHGGDPALFTAYEQCLRLERRGTEWNIYAADSDLQQPLSEAMTNDMTPRVVARVLGFGMLLAPKDQGRIALAREIIACNEDLELLAGLAHLYVYGLIRVCKCAACLCSCTALNYAKFTTPRARHLVSHRISVPECRFMTLHKTRLLKLGHRLATQNAFAH